MVLFKNLFNGFCQSALIILFYVVLLKVRGNLRISSFHSVLASSLVLAETIKISALILDKSGFLSGLVNHAVSAAMRTIMKV